MGRIWFPDDKLFWIKEGGKNSQNNRLWVFGDDDPDLRLQEREKFSKGVVVLLAVSKYGVGRLIFRPKGVKIDGGAFKQLMEREMWCRTSGSR